MAFLKSVPTDVDAMLDWINTIENEARSDPWPLVLALPQMTDDLTLELVCNALARFEPAQLEFFTPQLCQIVIDQGASKSRPIARMLLQHCRRSTRFAFRMHFIFQAAVVDEYPPETAHWCQQMLYDVQACLTSSDINPEFENLLSLYADHQNEMDLAQALASPRLPARKQSMVSMRDSLYNSRESIIVQQLPSNSPPSASPIAEMLSEEQKNLLSRTVQSMSHSYDGSGKKISAPSSTTTSGFTSPTSSPAPPFGGPNPSPTPRSRPTLLGSSNAVEIPKTGSRPQLPSIASTPPASVVTEGSADMNSISTPIDPSLSSSLPDSIPALPRLNLSEIPSSSESNSSHVPQTPQIATLKKEDPTDEEEFFLIDSEPEVKVPVKPALHAPTFTMEGYEKLNKFCSEVVNCTHSDNIQRKTLTKIFQFYTAFKSGQVAPMLTPITQHVNSPPDNLDSFADPEPEFVLREQHKSRQLRQKYISSQLRLIRGLTDISSVLITMNLKVKDLKNAGLRHSLKLLNSDKDFIKGIYTTILSPDGRAVRLLRIPAQEAIALNSRDRVPYLLNVEVAAGFNEQHSHMKVQHSAESEHRRESSLTITEAEKHPLLESFNEDEDGPLDSVMGNTTNSPSKPIEVTSKPLNTIGSNEQKREEAEKNVKVTKLSNFQIVDEWRVGSGSVEKSVLEFRSLDKAFGLNWPARKDKLRLSSPVGNAKGWDLISVIVKAGDDLRQEQLAMQIIHSIHDVFTQEGLPLSLRPYMVLATSADAGLIETVHDASSIDGLKKALGVATLREYFLQAYGNPDGHVYKKAALNFVESLSAYSLVCYLLQIKDRHNGNIMMLRDGRLLHIDYGFIFNNSPGNMQFERAPFKLPIEFVDVMGSTDSDLFEYFKTLLRSGFIAVRRHHQKILFLVETMRNAGNGKLNCYKNAEVALAGLRERFQLALSEEDMIFFTDQLVEQSCGNWSTDVYDRFQYFSNGIL